LDFRGVLGGYAAQNTSFFLDSPAKRGIGVYPGCPNILFGQPRGQDGQDDEDIQDKSGFTS
jgi:hypothetical protein